MALLIAALRRRQHTHRAGPAREDGFALILVLVATLVFGLIVVALLGMSMGAMAVRSSMTSDAASRRAADAAIETWINELRTSPGAVLGRSGQACDSGPLAVDSFTVVVRCEGEAPSGDPVSTGGVAGTTALTLLGGFTGPIADLAQAPNFLGTLNPLFESLDTSLSSTLPGFVHYGPRTLEIDGDVKVRQDGLVWHERDGVGIRGPAVAIDGKYQQGKVSSPFGGLYGWMTLFRRTPECGLLDPRFDRTWQDLIGVLPDGGFHIAATDGMSCRSSNVIVDPRWDPPVPATPWSSTRLRAGMSLPADCAALRPDPDVPVVRLSPGMYNRDDTSRLNDWLRTGNCDGVTFWFPPGDYYFDAAGTVSGDLSTRSSIVARDPTSNVVFGTPSGWDPAAGKAPDSAFPAACVRDGSQPGVTITMSPRTTLKHLSGLISACAARDADGDEEPLLFQAGGDDDMVWAGVPTAVTPTTFTDAGRALRSTAASKPLDWPTNAGPYDTSESSFQYATARCSGAYLRCTPKLSFTGFRDGAAYAYGDPKVAEVHLRGAASNVGDAIPGSRTVVTITFGDGSGFCRTSRLDVPRGDVVIDLLRPDPFANDVFRDANLCSRKLTDVAQLDGATVDVTFITVRNPWCVSIDPSVCDYSVRVDYAWLEARAGNRPPAMAQTAVDPSGTAPASYGRPTSMTLYGPVYLPRTQVVVDWRGQPNTDPIFGGGLVARALASGIDWRSNPDAQPGKLAGLLRVAGERKVQLAAVVGDRVRATATVRIVDASSNGRAKSPGRQVEVLSWATCNAPVAAPATPAVLGCP